MKNIILFILFVLQAALVTAKETHHLIAVNGVAERAVEPNMAILQIEVLGRGTSAKAAQEIQAKFYQKVKDAVEKFKVKKEDFKTENFSIQPEYVYDQKTQANRLTGYKVSHSVNIIFRGKTDQTGAFIDALVESRGDSGSVNVQNISWDYDQRAQVEKAALTDAVRSAKEKAEELAKAAGVKIKAVHRMEFISDTPSTATRGMEKMKMMADVAASAATEMTAGQVKVLVQVHMEFEI